MDAFLLTLGCVASQPEKKEDEQKEGRTKIKNMKILAKLKTKQAGDKEYLVDDDDKDVKVATTENINTEIKTNKKKLEKSFHNENNKKLNAINGVETFVEVVNGDVRKKFNFKNSVKVVNGQKYICKIGYNEENRIVFVRCLIVGQAKSEDANNSTEKSNGDDDITAFLDLS